MRRHLTLIILVVAALMTAGGAASAAGRRSAGLPPELLDVEWKLVTMQVGGQPAEDVTGQGLSITFMADGTVNGSGGCNRFFGGYTGDTSGTLAIADALGSTLIGCPTPIAERESRYFNALPTVRGYVLDSSSRLRLSFDQPDRLLVYTRAPAGMPQTGGGGMAGVTLPWVHLSR